MARRILARWLGFFTSSVGKALDVLFIAASLIILFSPEIAEALDPEAEGFDRRFAYVPLLVFLVASLFKATWDEARYWEQRAGVADGPILPEASVFIEVDDDTALATVEADVPGRPERAGRWLAIGVAMTATSSVVAEEVKLRIGGNLVDSTWNSDMISHGVTTTATLWFDIPASVSRGHHDAALETLAGGKWFRSHSFTVDVPPSTPDTSAGQR